MEAIGSGGGSIDTLKQQSEAKITAAKTEAAAAKQSGGDDAANSAAQGVGGAQGAEASQYPKI